MASGKTRWSNRAALSSSGGNVLSFIRYTLFSSPTPPPRHQSLALVTSYSGLKSSRSAHTCLFHLNTNTALFHLDCLPWMLNHYTCSITIAAAAMMHGITQAAISVSTSRSLSLSRCAPTSRSLSHHQHTREHTHTHTQYHKNRN